MKNNVTFGEPLFLVAGGGVTFEIKRCLIFCVKIVGKFVVMRDGVQSSSFNANVQRRDYGAFKDKR